MQSLPGPERTDAIDRLEARLCRKMGRTIETFRLIEPGDRIMVAMSGGKDSYALLTLLDRFRRRLPGPAVELIAFHLDQRQPGYDGEPLERWLENYGVEFRIHAQDTYSVVSEKVAEGRTYCSLCSRLRRGILYDQAEALGCSKIALGHHRDDAAETLLLNLFYSGQLKSMPPLLRSDDGRNVVIRPLMQCAEAEIATYAQGMGFPILPCNLCGSQEGLKRQRMKQMLSVLTEENDKVPGNIAAALANVRPSHLHQPELYQAWRDFRSVESDVVEA
ncbi:MAG TPA: tRNA 2-thiocytidine(32) synthetase TtcA [Myxococcales bacterium]|nr:tRNA 2-thiocytidine(32) synthetase TtcA [Myxococcales bacterium]HBU48281.1 tRNA 2-thiocytidine(32) synthetase TtcA [Myxococcales bacterium]